MIVGAGSVGTVLAGYLAHAGNAVTLVARPGYADALNEVPVRVFGISQIEVRVPVVGSLSSGGPDYLIMAVKAPDTEAALAAVEGVTPGTALSLQNGITKDDQLAAAFGRDCVLGATSIIGASMVKPGVAEHTFNGATLLGEIKGGSSERAERLAALLSLAGLRAETVPDVLSAEWSKLCQIVPAALLSALSRLPYYQVCLTEPLARLFVEITHECAAVAEVYGARVGDYPGFPIRTLIELPEPAAVAAVVERGRDLLARGMTAMKISMLQDVEKGRRTEVEATAGEVVHRGIARGIPTPVTTVGYQIVRGIDQASQQSDVMKT